MNKPSKAKFEVDSGDSEGTEKGTYRVQRSKLCLYGPRNLPINIRYPAAIEHSISHRSNACMCCVNSI